MRTRSRNCLGIIGQAWLSFKARNWLKRHARPCNRQPFAHSGADDVRSARSQDISEKTTFTHHRFPAPPIFQDKWLKSHEGCVEAIWGMVGGGVRASPPPTQNSLGQGTHQWGIHLGDLGRRNPPRHSALTRHKQTNMQTVRNLEMQKFRFVDIHSTLKALPRLAPPPAYRCAQTV